VTDGGPAAPDRTGPQLTPDSLAVPTSPKGWYPDPWNQAPWRWFDGVNWTAYTTLGQVNKPTKRPRLPAWLSVPVLLAALPTALLMLIYAVQTPIALALGIVPLFIVAPVLWWIDRVEPEPRSAKFHAFLWGLTVAGLVALVVNSLVDFKWGETVAAVASAPLVEEAMKGLGIVWALRRKEIDSPLDGIVYAGWVALGFAVVEDFAYFSAADSNSVLWQTFLTRAILTPFAHPLFTTWTGLAIGLAVVRRKRVFPHALWGYAVAVALHASWNGSLTWARDINGVPSLLISVGVFFILFVVGMIVLIVVRRREQQLFVTMAPMLVARYQLHPEELRVYSGWGILLRTRRSLGRRQRKMFDRNRAVLARLAHLHNQAGDIDSVREEMLVRILREVRTPSEKK
jgi:protease PrsW